MLRKYLGLECLLSSVMEIGCQNNKNTFWLYHIYFSVFCTFLLFNMQNIIFLAFSENLVSRVELVSVLGHGQSQPSVYVISLPFSTMFRIRTDFLEDWLDRIFFHFVCKVIKYFIVPFSLILIATLVNMKTKTIGNLPSVLFL